VFTVSTIPYAREVMHIDTGIMLQAVNIAAAVEFFTIPLFGRLSDHWSRRTTYLAGCLFLLAFAFPFFALLQTGASAWIILAIVVALAGAHAMLYSVQASLIPELFGTRLRCTGASIGYQLGAPLAGGLAPLIVTVLMEHFPGQYWPLACYLMLLAVISLACVLRLAETSKKDIAKEG
jgi:MHS family shikimate/dehydroshikimate transporter-like MFS transporter